tara:strand:- start:293 stop:397 length:105 start_codon:yes stop_codon:yes gene_type:complete
VHLVVEVVDQVKVVEQEILRQDRLSLKVPLVVVQ